MGSLPSQSGTLVINTVAIPPAGNPFLIQTPAGVQARIIGFRFALTTAAPVADRRVYYEIIDATRIITRIYSNTVQTATALRYYSVWSGFHGVPGLAHEEHILPWPNNYVQQQTFWVSVYVLNLQVGDAFSEIAYASEEWIADG